jgi:hypothetical protein
MTIAHQASRQTPEDKRRSDEGERTVFVDREPKLREDGRRAAVRKWQLLAVRVDCESPLTGVSNPTTASGSRNSRANR